MRTWCHVVAAILAAHAGAAFAGGYLGVTGPAPLRVQPLPPPPPLSVIATSEPASTGGDPTNVSQTVPASHDTTQLCVTNTPDDVAPPVTANGPVASSCTTTNSSPTTTAKPESSAATSSPDPSTEQPPLTSQVLAEIFRRTAGISSNQSTTVVVPADFIPPQPALLRSSSATYTDQ